MQALPLRRRPEGRCGRGPQRSSSPPSFDLPYPSSPERLIPSPRSVPFPPGLAPPSPPQPMASPTRPAPRRNPAATRCQRPSQAMHALVSSPAHPDFLRPPFPPRLDPRTHCPRSVLYSKHPLSILTPSYFASGPAATASPPTPTPPARQHLQLPSLACHPFQFNPSSPPPTPLTPAIASPYPSLPRHALAP